MINPVPLELTPEQEEALLRDVETQLSQALEDHKKREHKWAELQNAYRARPEVERKTYPWPGASNMVIPIVAITVDNVVARLCRSFMGVPNPFEVEIKEPQYEGLEKDVRDWSTMFMEKSGARDRLRTSFHDMAVDGTAYIKPVWGEKRRNVHFYGDAPGQITSTEINDYTGVTWNSIPACDVIRPSGFDEWNTLPWVAHRIRPTWQELKKQQAEGFYDNIDDQLKARTCTRSSPVLTSRRQHTKSSPDSGAPYEFFEISGSFEIPATEKDQDPQFADLILTYSFDDGRFHRKIYNPFFGRPKQIVRIPFLNIPHEIDGLGCAEMVLPFQYEASTAHNQSIDAATAAIAGIVVRKSSCETLAGKEIAPGAELVTDNPKEDFMVFHLTQGRSDLPNVEQKAAFWAEKRSGVSAYSMGVESPIAGSRATATGTTALISEGNLRFWVSIDDMRDAIADLLYLTLQLEQQYRPEGAPISEGRTLVLPQGDLRTIFGLRLQVSSEKVNRDIEIQNFQILITILNDYYAKVMQAAALILNPIFPPEQKMITLQVMSAAGQLIKRLVERFDISNVDSIVPQLDQALAMIGGQLGPGSMALAPGGGPQGPAQVPGGGPPGMPGAVPPGQGPQRPSPYTR